MSELPTSQPQTSGTTVVVNQQPSNTLGIAGFICSLLGILSCGLLAPVGLLLSFFALFKQPRGFAIAGTVVGFLGSIIFFTFGLAFILALVGITAGVAMVANVVETDSAMDEANGQIMVVMEPGAPLNDEQGDTLVGAILDGWENPLEYTLTVDGYNISSASFDGVHGSEDDLVREYDKYGNVIGGSDLEDWDFEETP